MPKEKVIHYPNGAIKEKKYLLEGKIHGQYTTYFPSGQIMAQLHFSSGKCQWTGAGKSEFRKR